MAVNKVVVNTPDGERILIDLTMLTVEPHHLVKGVIAMNAAGELIVGTHECGSYTAAKLGVAKLGTMTLGE